MSGVNLSKVVKRYGALEVVHGIDLEIQPREFVVLVGPSGCGKSTTLRMIAGLEEISDGIVSIGDRVVNKVAPKDRDVAMVFQNYALYPHLSVADNIAFGLKLRRVKKAEIQSSVTEVAATLGLTDYLDRRPADLSGGQRQRVAMGRAIVRHPEVFLFDEPLSNLDAKLRTQMRAEIKRLHKRLGVTSIYVTHDQVEAMTLADRIVVMQDGRIEQIGAPMDLFNNPVNTFVAGFIGSPPMNQMPGRLRLNADGPSVVLTDGQVLKLAPDARLEAAIVGGDGRKLIVGIRPEHAQIMPVKGMNTLKIDVDLVEPLGSEALVHGHVADLPFVAKVETHGRIDGLDHVTELSIDPAQIKLFSAETGRALGHAMDDHLPSAFAATTGATATGAKNAVAT